MVSTWVSCNGVMEENTAILNTVPVNFVELNNLRNLQANFLPSVFRIHMESYFFRTILFHNPITFSDMPHIHKSIYRS